MNPSKWKTGDTIKTELFRGKITVLEFAAILNYSNFTYVTYCTLHCRHSKDIARQPRDNSDGKRHSQKTI